MRHRFHPLVRPCAGALLAGAASLGAFAQDESVNRHAADLTATLWDIHRIMQDVGILVAIASLIGLGAQSIFGSLNFRRLATIFAGITFISLSAAATGHFMLDQRALDDVSAAHGGVPWGHGHWSEYIDGPDPNIPEGKVAKLDNTGHEQLTALVSKPPPNMTLSGNQPLVAAKGASQTKTTAQSPPTVLNPQPPGLTPAPLASNPRKTRAPRTASLPTEFDPDTVPPGRSPQDQQWPRWTTPAIYGDARDPQLKHWRNYHWRLPLGTIAESREFGRMHNRLQRLAPSESIVMAYEGGAVHTFVCDAAGGSTSAEQCHRIGQMPDSHINPYWLSNPLQPRSPTPTLDWTQTRGWSTLENQAAERDLPQMMADLGAGAGAWSGLSRNEYLDRLHHAQRLAGRHVNGQRDMAALAIFQARALTPEGHSVDAPIEEQSHLAHLLRTGVWSQLHWLELHSDLPPNTQGARTFCIYHAEVECLQYDPGDPPWYQYWSAEQLPPELTGQLAEQVSRCTPQDAGCKSKRIGLNDELESNLRALSQRALARNRDGTPTPDAVDALARLRQYESLYQGSAVYFLPHQRAPLSAPPIERASAQTATILLDGVERCAAHDNPIVCHWTHTERELAEHRCRSTEDNEDLEQCIARERARTRAENPLDPGPANEKTA